MEPILPNSLSNTCGNPISTNCVVSNSSLNMCCIPTCSGDTLTDILNKLAARLCSDEQLISVSGVDFSCWYTPCPSGCSGTPTNIVDALNMISSYLCKVKSAVNNLNAQIIALGGASLPNI